MFNTIYIPYIHSAQPEAKSIYHMKYLRQPLNHHLKEQDAIDRLKNFRNGLFNAMECDYYCSPIYHEQLEQLKEIHGCHIEYDDCVDSTELGIIKGNNKINFININRFTPDYNGFTTTMVTHDVLEKIRVKLNDYLLNCKDKLTFVVFDEMFWSQLEPINEVAEDGEQEVTKQDIDDMLRNLSSQYKNVFFVVNYLYKSRIDNQDEIEEEKEKFRQYLQDQNSYKCFETLANLIDYNLKCIMDEENLENDDFVMLLQNIIAQYNSFNNEYSMNDFILQYITNQLLNRYGLANIYEIDGIINLVPNIIAYINTEIENLGNNAFYKFQNQTSVIHNGETLITHNKKNYFNEYNEGIFQHGYTYDPGDGYNKIVHPELNANIKKYIQKHLGIEICLDLNCEVSVENNFYMTNANDIDPELFIVQSDIIDIHEDNKYNLPFNTVILHSDKGRAANYKNSAGLRFLSYMRSHGENNANISCENIDIETITCNPGSDIFIAQQEGVNDNLHKFEDYVNITSVELDLL